MEKKGSAHLEIVTAFTIFIVFTIFLLGFIKVPENKLSPDNLLDRLESSFVDFTQTELVSFLIKPNDTGCVKLDLTNFSLEGNSSVVTLSGKKIEMISGVPTITDIGTRDSQFSGNFLSVDTSNINLSENESLRVYISEGIDIDSFSCTPNAIAEIGPVKREKALSEKKFEEFKQNYTNNYTYLKKDILNLPDDVDFAITSTTFINVTKSRSNDLDIFTKDYLLRVVSSDGDVSLEVINFQIW